MLVLETRATNYRWQSGDRLEAERIYCRCVIYRVIPIRREAYLGSLRADRRFRLGCDVEE